MATVFKSIKPARLKEDAFRLYMLNARRKFGTEVKAEYGKTTATWKHAVVFETLISLSGSAFTVLVDTSDKIYAYVDRGTKPHIIRAKKPGGRLRFNSKFTAQTIPGVVGSAAGYSGGAPVFAQQVHHPGTKPRDFTKNIEAVYKGKFKKYCQEALAQFAKGSGHYAGRK